MEQNSLHNNHKIKYLQIFNVTISFNLFVDNITNTNVQTESRARAIGRDRVYDTFKKPTLLL